MTTTLETSTSRHTWVPYAAIAAGAGWLLMTALVLGSNDEIDAPAVALYFASLALSLAAAIGQGLRVGGGKGAAIGAGLCLAVIAWIMGVGDYLKPLFEQFSDETYVADQGPLAVLGLVLLGLGAWSRSSD